MTRGKPKDAQKEIARLVSVFRENVIAQTDAIGNEGRSGNVFAGKRTRAFAKLREQFGDSGRDALAVLMTDVRPDVRVTAAVYMLRYRHQEAIAVLRKAAAKESMVGFEAGEAIKRWNEGVWSVDPETWSGPEA
ncbi:MAG TPA: hypothetical protein VFP10_14895 [Candidatus Eisenbacteria bacterium]|nr:hypothetical protein [Candidatus Eisenbacteria bacterium]